MAFSLFPQSDAMDELSKKLNRKFIDQLNASDGQPPKLSAADLKYARMLQERRLQAKGVTLKVTYEPDDPPLSAVSWKMDSDTRYITRLPVSEVRTKRSFSVGGREKKTSKRKEWLYSYIVWLRGQPPEAPCSCPNCGGATTLGNLTDGCRFCGTRFMAEDLYPKVVHYYTLPTKNLLNRLKPFMIVCIVASLLFSLLMNGSQMMAGLTSGDMLSVIGWVLYLPVVILCGAVLGYITGAIYILGEMLVRAIASIPSIIRYGTAKRRLPRFMRRYAPDFSSDRFIGKLLSILNILVYSGNLENCALYGGKPVTHDFSDIIDMSYNGYLGVRDCQERDGYLYITLDMYMDVFTCKGETIRHGNRTFRMTVCRNASAPEDHGFNAKAIQCRSCGGSFDATKEKHCPFCSTEYNLRDYDWVVTDFR